VRQTINQFKYRQCRVFMFKNPTFLFVNLSCNNPLTAMHQTSLFLAKRFNYWTFKSILPSAGVSMRREGRLRRKDNEDFHAS